jgi:DNA polymerase-3 subunit alpha
MHLNCHSYYSFKYGTLSPGKLVEEAKQLGIKKIALTDINSSSGSLYFVRDAQATGLQPVLGVDFRISALQQYIMLAENNEGFHQINMHLSDILCKRIKQPSIAPSLENTIVIYPLQNAPKQLQDNEYVGIQENEIISYLTKHKNYWKQTKCVALAAATFITKRDYNAHRLLRAIDKNILLSQLTENEQGKLEDQLYSEKTLRQKFAAAQYLLNNAKKLLDKCSISFRFDGQSQNKKQFLSSPEEDLKRLTSLAEDGLTYRYGSTTVSEEIRQRLEKELRIINNYNFVPYFLVNHSIIQYARSQGYFYVGRGSGANSLVAYLLRITNVDPIELDLYFERFINPSRKSPPDFDIDFSWRDRNDVTKFIFETFPNTALLGAFVTFQKRSVIREIGKVLGVPSADITAIQRRENNNSLDHIQRLCLLYSEYIHGFPNHLSVHASGIVITEKPITYFGGMSLPPKGFPTAHFDMHIAEDAGIHKYDILSQRGLGKIKDAITVIKQNQPKAPDFDIDDVAKFKKDENIKALLREGDTVGCFYIESPAMRGLMRKLEVDNYRGLVAASSIIRPGVAESGMMTEYIKRHRNPNLRLSVQPVLGQILDETYGVMVYQEDVLKVAHYFAGLTLEESEILRRGMSWKFRERIEFKQVKDQFFKNCKAKGYELSLVSEIWKQIESFANFAFAKGHSASYAVESYQSLFLKAYYPLEYMVATVNNGGGFYRVEHYLQEARLKGGTICVPCINRSEIHTIIEGSTIILGFQHIKELEHQAVADFISIRGQFGKFKNFENFISRTAVSLSTAIVLIRAGAFHSMKKTKSWLLWKAHFLLNKPLIKAQNNSLFPSPVQVSDVEIPKLESLTQEDAYDELMYFGFPLCSPFDLLESRWLEQYSKDSTHFEKCLGKPIALVAYLVHTKRTSTRGKYIQDMGFGTFMDRAGKLFDSVHFPYVYKKYRFKGKGCYLVKGKISDEYGHLTLEASYLEYIPYNPAMFPS